MAVNRDPFQEETLDVKKLVFKYVRFWYWFVIAVSVSLTIAYFINKFSETVYRSRATVLIRDDRRGGFRPGQIMGELDLFNQRNNLFNEMSILRSYSLVDSALRKMDVGVSYYNIGRVVGEIRSTEIYTNTPFNVVWDDPKDPLYNRPFNVKILSEDTYQIELPGRGRSFFRNGNDKYTVSFGEMHQTDGYRFRLEKNDNFSTRSHVGREFIFVVHDVSTLAGRYLSSLSVSPLNDEVSIVQVVFEATNAQRAVDFLNTLTEVYIRQSLLEKNTIAENTIHFIDDQIAITSDSLFLAESTLQEFRQREQLMDMNMVSSQLFGELQRLDNQKAIEQVKRKYYDYLEDYVENGKDFRDVFSPSALGIEDPLLNKLISDLSNLYGERARLEVRSTLENPNIQMLDREIEQTLKALRDNLQSIKRASDILLADLEQRIQRVENRISQLPGTERELIGIQRKFNLNDATYNYLLEKRAEAGIAMASNVSDHKIIDRARFTSVVAPKTRMNYTIALVIGFALPLAFLVIRDFFDNKITDKKDVTNMVDFPILAIIPHNKVAARSDKLNLLVFDDNKSPVTEAFRAMRTNLQYFASGKDNKVIALTSTRSEEGKTFSAINLASVLSLSEKKTLLLGADLRKPRIYCDFGILKFPGLTNYLIGNNSLDEVIQKSGQNDFLHIITAGHTPPNPSELIESEKMGELLKILRSQYDYIIIDTPPIGIVPDGIHIIKNADISVFIVRQRYSDKSSLEFLNEFATKVGAKNICIEINDVKMSHGGYGYDYGYGYGYGYSYYEDQQAGEGNLFKRWYELMSQSLRGK